MPIALACVIGNAVCAAVIPVVGVSNQKPNTACRSRSTTTESSETLSLSGSGTTPSLGTFDVVTVPVHPNVRDAACASDATIRTDTSADSSRDVCDRVSKLPRSRQDIPLSCPRAYGLAPPAWRYSLHAGGVWLRGNALRQIYAYRQEIGFLHPLHLPNVAIFRLSGGPSVHLRGSIHGIS
jgi:hypothetical protein